VGVLNAAAADAGTGEVTAPGLHEAEFRVSADVPDKKSLLADKLEDMISNPAKYAESSGYAGFLLLAGSIVN
jgi:hypothetical protein